MTQSNLHILYSLTDPSMEDAILKKYLPMLPDFLQEKIKGYKMRAEQVASLSGICLLIHGLKKSGEAPHHLGGLRFDKNNRPFLKDLPDIDFNISHSGLLVACAVARKVRVGIDIENHQPINIYNLRAQFTLKQWDELENTENAQSLFYKLWVQKEALLKADGSGLSISPSSLEIESNRAIVRQKLWYLQDLDLPMDYSGCLASDSLVVPLIEWVSL